MRFRLLGLVVAAILPVSVLAERYGSETALTLQGTCYLSGETSTQTLDNGDTRATATHTLVQINNQTILQAMKSRGLIPATFGYQLVMVSHAHMADGIAWFAVKNTGTPVAVPADLLTLDVSDGPANGQLVVGSNAVLKSLNQQTHNLAYISQGDFTGSTVLSQTWKSKSVKNGTVTEGVELVTSAGTFTGDITSATTSGVGSLVLNLTGAKIVDLTRYGMATTTTSTYGGSSSSASATSTGCTTAGAGSLTLAGTNNYTVAMNVNTLTLAGSGVIGGALTVFNSSLAPGYVNTTSPGGEFPINYEGTTTFTNNVTLNLSGANSASTTIFTGAISIGNHSYIAGLSGSVTPGTLTINTTTGGNVTGLVVDADGNVTHFPDFGASLPDKLIIITSSGTHTYTHDANGVWTLVTP